MSKTRGYKNVPISEIIADDERSEPLSEARNEGSLRRLVGRARRRTHPCDSCSHQDTSGPGRDDDSCLYCRHNWGSRWERKTANAALTGGEKGRCDVGENAERAVPSEAMLAEIQSKVPSDRCEVCLDTGYYGDNGPGIRGNREYQPCDYCTPCEREPRKANASVRGGAAAPYPARSVGLESKGGDA